MNIKPEQKFFPIADPDNIEELLPLIEDDKDEGGQEGNYPENLPVLPVRNTVLFPGVIIPITIGRKRSIRLVKKAYRGDKIIGVLAQENANIENPIINDLYKIGTVAKILKMLVLPDGNTTIIIRGKVKFEIDHIVSGEPFLTARVKYLPESFSKVKDKKTKVMINTLKEQATKMFKLNPEVPQEAQIAIKNIDQPGFLINFLSSNLNAKVADKQKLLEINDGIKKTELLLEYIMKEIQLLEIKHEIQSKAVFDIDKQQRDFFLRQQMKVLQDELGDESADQEIDKLRARGKKKKWPEAVAKHFNKELDKLLRIHPHSPEYPVSMNYVEFLVDMPWNEYSKDKFNLNHAQKILEADHHGLEKVKERIIEYLSVLKLKNNMKAPIVCFYGPPGVGKTSLGKSIARALGRKCVRMSLGGVRDEAEIRGHRKTYIGAMPGSIIKNIKKSKYSNPVFILDEIDKIGTDFRGDPASALLEALDPEQNESFVDNYLEVDYDLSRVLFITTANSLETIPPALKDRMEIIEINGYTPEEKIQIAKKHLIPKQRTENGLSAKDIKFTPQAINRLIQDYTRESGVRQLERKVASVIRKVAKSIVLEEKYNKTIQPKDVLKYMGAPEYDNELYEKINVAGVATGLAWTQFGGEILFIESTLFRGKGKLTLSGQLGDVMKESATAALSYLKTNAGTIGIDHRVFDNFDLHIHVPSGAVPKDGPSAGITIFTSLASVFTQTKIKDKLAMTGEITLRGKVLPVGGIKEKILAAKRAGIKELIICAQNKKDVDEIKPDYIKDLKIHYVENVDEVLGLALTGEKVEKPVDLSVKAVDKKLEYQEALVE